MRIDPPRPLLLVLTLLPVAGIVLSAVIEATLRPSDPMYGGLMLIGYFLSYVGTGAVFFLWAIYYRRRGRTAVGDAFVRGIFLVMASFVGWSLILKYLPVTVPNVAIFETLIVTTAVVGTGLLIVRAAGGGYSLLLSKQFGLTLGLASLIAYVLYLAVTNNVSIYTMTATFIFMIIVGRHLIPVVFPAGA